MEAQLRTITKETLLILAGVLVAFYTLKLSVENKVWAQGEFSNVINNDAYYTK